MATLVGIVLGSSGAVFAIVIASILFGVALGHGIQKIVCRRFGL